MSWPGIDWGLVASFGIPVGLAGLSLGAGASSFDHVPRPAAATRSQELSGGEVEVLLMLICTPTLFLAWLMLFGMVSGPELIGISALSLLLGGAMGVALRPLSRRTTRYASWVVRSAWPASLAVLWLSLARDSRISSEEWRWFLVGIAFVIGLAGLVVLLALASRKYEETPFAQARAQASRDARSAALKHETALRQGQCQHNWRPIGHSSEGDGGWHGQTCTKCSYVHIEQSWDSYGQERYHGQAPKVGLPR